MHAYRKVPQLLRTDANPNPSPIPNQAVMFCVMSGGDLGGGGGGDEPSRRAVQGAPPYAIDFWWVKPQVPLLPSYHP